MDSASLEFIDGTGYCRYAAETGRRHPCHRAVADSLGPIATEIPQLQFIDQVFDVLVAKVQQIRAKSWETVEIPQLQLVFLLNRLLLARCVQQQVPMVDDSCSSSMVVNVPVIMRDSGSAPDSGHRELGGPSS